MVERTTEEEARKVHVVQIVIIFIIASLIPSDTLFVSSRKSCKLKEVIFFKSESMQLFTLL
jgi:hypothetical protein